MNKAIIAVLAALVICGGYWLLKDKSTPVNQVTTEREATPQATDASPNTTQLAGAYIDYRVDVVMATPGTKILFFHAPWCPECRALDKDIKANPVPTGVTIIKTDYDTNQALRKKYGVTIQTTLVKIDDQGNLIKKFVAYESPTLKALEDNLL